MILLLLTSFKQIKHQIEQSFQNEITIREWTENADKFDQFLSLEPSLLRNSMRRRLTSLVIPLFLSSNMLLRPRPRVEMYVECQMSGVKFLSLPASVISLHYMPASPGPAAR